jgi:hypothetical protein
MTNEPTGNDVLDQAEAAASAALESPPPDDQTMDGYEGPEPDADGEPPSDDGEQDTYLLSDIPDGYILAPADAEFANATWLRAGPDIVELVNEVFALDPEGTDFPTLAPMSWSVVWRRQTSPARNGEPSYASVWLPDPRVEWEVLKHGIEDFPRFIVDIHWKHFADLRKEKEPPAVHRDYIKRDIHFALARLLVTNDRISQRPITELLPANAREFGAHGDGARGIKRAFDGWPELLDG